MNAFSTDARLKPTLRSPPLREETDRNNNQHAFPVAGSLEEGEVRRLTVDLALHAQRREDLGVLEHD